MRHEQRDRLVASRPEDDAGRNDYEQGQEHDKADKAAAGERLQDRCDDDEKRRVQAELQPAVPHLPG